MSTQGTITAKDHTYADNGSYTGNVTVTDKDGGSDSKTFKIDVANVAPSDIGLGAGSQETLNEGDTFSTTVSFNDPGADTWTATVDWGDGSGVQSLGSVGKTFNISHTYTDNPPAPATSYTGNVTVTDDDGGSGFSTFEVTVLNVAPTVEAGSYVPVAWGNTFTSAGNFTDPGIYDNPWTVNIDWGDGSSEPAFTMGTQGDITPKTHVYAAPGTYIGNISVTDKDGDTGWDTATITVNRRGTTLVYSGNSTGQYSDPTTVKATLTDNGGGALQGTPISGKTITFTLGTQSTTATTNGAGNATGSITLNQASGGYTVVSAFAGDAAYLASSDSDPFTIYKEDTTMTSNNPTAIQVERAGGAAPAFSIKVTITQANDGYPGNLGLIHAGDLTFTLTPVGGGSGSTIPGVSGTLPGEFLFNIPAGKAVDTYSISVTLNNAYFTALNLEDVLVVYDPSLGFTTGGGWFYWPGTQDKTNFGFNMKYNKNATNVQGSLLLIRHLADGSIYRIKSNQLGGLALSASTAPPPGWASFSGKCTYLGPDVTDNTGGQQFMVYVTDGNNPGTLSDTFWFTVLGKQFTLDNNGNKVADPGEVITLSGGNIVVPHAAPGKTK
jgi:hypothetical protein